MPHGIIEHNDHSEKNNQVGAEVRPGEDFDAADEAHGREEQEESEVNSIYWYIFMAQTVSDEVVNVVRNNKQVSDTKANLWTY